MKNFFYKLPVLLSLMLLAACSSDNSSAMKPSDLVGAWVCVGGTLNGEKAELMIKDEATQNPGALIEISESVLKFEALADLEKSKEQPYKLEDKKIVCTNDKDLVFNVKSIEGKKMTLAFMVGEYNFELLMERK